MVSKPHSGRNSWWQRLDSDTLCLVRTPCPPSPSPRRPSVTPSGPVPRSHCARAASGGVISVFQLRRRAHQGRTLNSKWEALTIRLSLKGPRCLLGLGVHGCLEKKAGLREWHPLACSCSFSPTLMTVRTLAHLPVPSANLSSRGEFSLIQRVALMSLLR